MFPAILIGAVLGFAFGRLPGLIFGALAGWWLGRQLGRVSPTRLIAGAAQHQFLESTFAVAGAISKADGRVDQSEIAALETMMQRFRFSPDQRKQAIAAFNRGKQTGFDVDAEVRQFRATCRGQMHLIQVFLTAQIQVAIADGRITDAERELLFRVGRGLGLSERDLARLDASLRMAQGGGAAGGRRPPQRDELADAYKIIGVDSSASDAEVKKAYRRLMSEHHPDRLAAKGLPESMRAVAEQKTSEITRAYDLIKQARAS
ncbi:co-chaperone DjlA [uncultured Abyssibacter sp.]|uniref:co-chaperone DjlA n=1 Tax=uncultured Abyssibacter sp. TaxID=2320202 RepID=UPI0032B29404